MQERFRESILAEIDAQAQELVDLECSLVAIPSYTTEETQLAEFIATYMQDFGLNARLQEVRLLGGDTSHNVIGRLPGSGQGPTLLLFGHMDHSPTLGRKYANFEGWKRDPFKPSVEGEWIYGKGSQDEKGGLCAMITAAKALVRAGFKPKGDIYFSPVQGHKRVSSGILHLLGTGLKADYAINTENSGNAIVPTWVGRAEGSVRVRAPKLHFHRKEQFPELKIRKTAFELIMRLVQALGPEMAPPNPKSWMSYAPVPGFEGYPQIRIEKLAFHNTNDLELTFQVRTVPDQTDDLIRADLERLVSKLHEEEPYFTAQITWPSAPSRPAGNTPVAHPLVRSMARWHQFVTGEMPDIGSRGRIGAAADASHVVGRLNTPTVLYGPGGGMTDLDHWRSVLNGQLEPDERIRIGDIVVAAKVYALVAAELCR